MTEDEAFNIWMSRVEIYLESMVKKSTNELNVRYDFLQDFKNNVQPEYTATLIIRKAYHRAIPLDEQQPYY